MRNFSIFLGIFAALFGMTAIAQAVQITVPSAPSSNYTLLSSGPGLYSSTPLSGLFANSDILTKGWAIATSSVICASPEACQYQTDGTADDVQFQSALNAGGTIRVKRGTYAFDTSVYLRSNINLIIDPGAIIYFPNGAHFPSFVETGVHVPPNYFASLFLGSGLTNVNVQNDGLMIPNTLATSTGMSAFWISTSSAVTITGGRYTNCDSGVWITDSASSTVQNIVAGLIPNSLFATTNCQTTLVDEGGVNMKYDNITNSGGTETVDINAYTQYSHISNIFGNNLTQEVVDVNESPNNTIDNIYGNQVSNVVKITGFSGVRTSLKAKTHSSDGNIVSNVHGFDIYSRSSGDPGAGVDVQVSEKCDVCTDDGRDYTVKNLIINDVSVASTTFGIDIENKATNETFHASNPVSGLSINGLQVATSTNRILNMDNRLNSSNIMIKNVIGNSSDNVTNRAIGMANLTSVSLDNINVNKNIALVSLNNLTATNIVNTSGFFDLQGITRAYISNFQSTSANSPAMKISATSTNMTIVGGFIRSPGTFAFQNDGTNSNIRIYNVDLTNVTPSNYFSDATGMEGNVPGSVGLGILNFATGTIAMVAAPSSISPIFDVASSTLTATSSVLYMNPNGWLGLSTSSPGSIFSIGSVANFTFGTSTFYSTGGINIANGCFAVNGTCITAGSSSGTTAVSTSSAETAGQLSFWTTTSGSPAQLSGGSVNLTWDNTNNYLIVGNPAGKRVSIANDPGSANIYIRCPATDCGGTTHSISLDPTGTLFDTAYFDIANGGGAGRLDMTSLTAPRNFVYMDQSGTVCLVGIACDGSGVWPLTPSTNFGVAAQSTTTPEWFKTGVFASSTSQFVNAGIWGNLTLNATSSALLATDASGNIIATSSVGVNYLTGLLPIANGGTATSTQVTNGVNFFDGTRLSSSPALTWASNAMSFRGASAVTGGSVSIIPSDNVGASQPALNIKGFSSGTAAVDTSSGSLRTLQFDNTSSGGLRMILAGGTGPNQLGIGTTTPAADFQVTNSSANATTTVDLGKASQNKGSCLKLYRTDGSAIYAYVAAGATAFTLTTTACATVTNF